MFLVTGRVFFFTNINTDNIKISLATVNTYVRILVNYEWCVFLVHKEFRLLYNVLTYVSVSNQSLQGSVLPLPSPELERLEVLLQSKPGVQRKYTVTTQRHTCILITVNQSYLFSGNLNHPWGSVRMSIHFSYMYVCRCVCMYVGMYIFFYLSIYHSFFFTSSYKLCPRSRIHITRFFIVVDFVKTIWIHFKREYCYYDYNSPLRLLKPKPHYSLSSNLMTGLAAVLRFSAQL